MVSNAFCLDLPSSVVPHAKLNEPANSERPKINLPLKSCGLTHLQLDEVCDLKYNIMCIPALAAIFLIPSKNAPARIR